MSKFVVLIGPLISLIGGAIIVFSAMRHRRKRREGDLRYLVMRRKLPGFKRASDSSIQEKL